MLAQDFTNDHELAAKALRLPLGGGGAFSSPYLALLDLMKRLPSSADRRSILLISSGIDYFRGNFDFRSPDLDSTISRAQKQNINIWTIYAPDAGHRARGFFLISRAQSNLSQLSDETGAESYYLGTGAPRVSFGIHVQTSLRGNLIQLSEPQSHSGGASNESCSRNPRVFQTPNAMPAAIQIEPAIIAGRLRFSHSARQIINPRMGGIRLISFFSSARR